MSATRQILTLAAPEGGPDRAHVRTTLAFSALDDHARLPARFFGRLIAAHAT